MFVRKKENSLGSLSIQKYFYLFFRIISKKNCTFATSKQYGEKEMRIGIISLAMILLMVGKNCTDININVQGLLFCHQMETNMDTDQSSVDDCGHFIAESSQWSPNAGEKPVFSHNIVTVVRQLSEKISLKKFCVKQLIKIRLYLRETVFRFCHSLKLYDGYYTFGIGKLRC
jgi:hypothetical protein